VLEIKTTSNKLVAGDLEINSGVTVHNPELVIANFNSSAERNFKVFIGSGIGHVSDDGYEPRMVLPEGFIKIAASFSPVSRVSYSVEEKTNLNASGGKKQDSLKLNLDTDGSMEGVEVVRMAATIMQSNLELIAHASSHTEVKSNDCVETEQDKALKKKITELNISVRSLNCLKSADIETLGDLISFPERHLLKLPNFGKVSLKEIKEILTKYNIVLNK
jgi:DNA-directed RNA polymerase subunit alpha